MFNHKARIISGFFKRRIIKTPNCDQLVRPTTDMLREIIFNILENSFYINIKEFDTIDICAGSGAFGLESISRGSPFCKFVDKNHISLQCIHDNVKNLCIENRCNILRADVMSIDVGALIQNKTIAFIDPPYANKNLIEKVINDITKTQKEVLCVIESDDELDFIQPDLVKKRGKSVVSFLKTQHSHE